MGGVEAFYARREDEAVNGPGKMERRMLNRQIMRVGAGILGLILFASASLRVNAITVQEIGVNPYETPTINCTGIGTVTVYAGINRLVVDGTAMNGFCIDPFHFSLPSSPGYSFVALTSAPKDHNMSSGTALLIERLWGSYYAPALNNATTAAGLQLAIWELVGGSSFTLVSPNDYGAAGFISAVESPGYGGSVADLLGLTGPGQDYTVQNLPGTGGGNTVPDGGSTLALVGTALCGLAAIRRKLSPA